MERRYLYFGGDVIVRRYFQQSRLNVRFEKTGVYNLILVGPIVRQAIIPRPPQKEKKVEVKRAGKRSVLKAPSEERFILSIERNGQREFHSIS